MKSARGIRRERDDPPAGDLRTAHWHSDDVSAVSRSRDAAFQPPLTLAGNGDPVCLSADC